MKRVAIYPGTFDPMTNGHVDLIERALTLFDEVIVAIAENPGKKPLFCLAERVQLAEQVLLSYDNVTVKGFNNLLTDFLRQEDTPFVIRGLRAASDFEYEFMLTGMNRRLMPEIETIYLLPSEQYMFISSTFVREVAALKGELGQFVPEVVAAALSAAFSGDES